MRAIIASRSGPELVQRPIPVVDARNNCLLRVALTALCRTDGYIARGEMAARREVILGHEFCGYVEEAPVGRFSKGQRVAVMPMFRDAQGQWLSLGKDEDGAFAEYIAVPESLLYAVPEQLSDREVAYLEPIAASMSVLAAPIVPAMRGAIYGNNRIAELTRRVLVLQGFAAVDVLENGARPLSGSYDFIIETVATDASFDAIAYALKPRGIWVMKSRPHGSVRVPVTMLVQKELRIHGTHYAPMEEAVALLASGRLAIDDLLGEIHPLEAAVTMLASPAPASEDKKLFFKP